MVTKDEALVISAYTHTIMVRDFGEFRTFVEEVFERNVSDEEMARNDFWEELRRRVYPRFLELCRAANV